jgi:hypothetical protein
MCTLGIVIGSDAADYVARSAEARGIRTVDVVRKALEAYRYLERVSDRDGRVAVQRASGAIFESQAAEHALIAEQNWSNAIVIIYGVFVVLAFMCIAILAGSRTSQPRDDRGRFVRKDTP